MGAKAMRMLSALIIGTFAFAPQVVIAADTGAIQGNIDKAKLVKAVVAVDRTNDKKFPGKVDAQTGRFTIDGLPLEAAYDCVIDLEGARLEGVNLRVPRSDFEEEQPLSDEDRKALKESVARLNQFEDKVEVLAIQGNIQHAAVIINKLRTKPFINSQPGEVVWRLELWHFEKPDETWVKVQDELFLVLYRERLQKKDFEKKALTLDGALGGLQVTKEKPTLDVGGVQLPSNEPGIRLRSEKSSRAK
jgi:hypothetical protein